MSSHEDYSATWSSRRSQCPECGAKRGLATKSNGFAQCKACGYIRKSPDYVSHDPTEDDFSDRNVSLDGLIPQEQIRIVSIPDRGISAKVCEKYRYGKSEYRKRPCRVAQFADSSGTVVAQKLRYTDGQEPKFCVLGDTKAIKMFGLDSIRDGSAYAGGYDTKLVITEGEEDALAVAEAMESNFWPAVSLPQGASNARKVLQANLEALEKFDQIYLCFDEDEPGRRAVKECLDLFSPGKVRVTRLPLKDACDVLKDRGKAVLKQAIYESKQHRPEGLVSGDAIWEAIVSAKSVRGEPYPWTGLDDKLRGIRGKELILLTGGTGTGKSTLSRTLCEHILKAGHTVGYVALEESVQQSALGIYGVALGQSFTFADSLPLDSLKEVHGRYGSSLHLFDHFGSTETSALISKLRFLVKGLGCEVIFLDHITIAISGLAIEDERKALDKMMTDLRSLVEETGCTLFLISHLRRPKEGAHEEGKPVRISDLRGSQSLGQLPDIIIAAERNQQAKSAEEQNTVKLRVLKNRPVGLLGVCCALRYDNATGLFTETSLIEDDPEEDFE